ncbi:MAG: hypothetical protein ACRCYT_00450 [Cetobacterium sp.]
MFNKSKKYVNEKMKFSEVRKGMFFSDDSEVKKKYFYDNNKNYIIFLNQNKEIIYKIRGIEKNSIDKIKKIALVNGELNLVPNLFREDLNLQMAFIYKLAILNDPESSEKALILLENGILSRKKILKQFTYLITPIFLSMILYFLTLILYFLTFIAIFNNQGILKIIFKHKILIIFSGIGSFLSISKNIDKIEFNTSETVWSYFIFSSFKYVNSLFCSIMLILLYTSKLINIEFKAQNEELFMMILATLGSFSEGLIPNIFDKLSGKILDEK